MALAAIAQGQRLPTPGLDQSPQKPQANARLEPWPSAKADSAPRHAGHNFSHDTPPFTTGTQRNPLARPRAGITRTYAATLTDSGPRTQAIAPSAGRPGFHPAAPHLAASTGWVLRATGEAPAKAAGHTPPASRNSHRPTGQPNNRGTEGRALSRTSGPAPRGHDACLWAAATNEIPGMIMIRPHLIRRYFDNTQIICIRGPCGHSYSCGDIVQYIGPLSQRYARGMVRQGADILCRLLNTNDRDNHLHPWRGCQNRRAAP